MEKIMEIASIIEENSDNFDEVKDFFDMEITKAQFNLVFKRKQQVLEAIYKMID
jgi:hypothetical protein